MISGWKSNIERQIVVEATVAHFGAFKLMRIGWEEELAEADVRLRVIGPEVKRLAEEHAKLAGENAGDVRKEWQVIRQLLAISQSTVSDVQTRYGLSADERTAMAKLVARKQAEASGEFRLTSPPADDLLPDKTPTKADEKWSRSTPAKDKTEVPVKKPEAKSKPLPPEQGAALPNGKLK